MTESTDVVEFVRYLESGDANVVSEFRQVIYENLHSSKDGSFLNALIESYLQNKSSQLLDILAGVKDSHCQVRDVDIFWRASDPQNLTLFEIQPPSMSMNYLQDY